MYIKKCYYAQAAFYSDNLKYYKIPFCWDVNKNGDCIIKVLEITPGNIHIICDLFLPRNDIDFSSFSSDLYIRVTQESKKIISELKSKSLLTTFTDNIDRVLWYDLPFCKNPELAKRREKNETTFN